MEDKVRYVFVPQLMRHRSQSVFREHYSTIQAMQWPVGCVFGMRGIASIGST